AEAARRSIVAARDLSAGHVLAWADLTWLRPAGGLPPGREASLIGRRLRCAVAAGGRLPPRLGHLAPVWDRRLLPAREAAVRAYSGNARAHAPARTGCRGRLAPPHRGRLACPSAAHAARHH